MGGFFLGLLLPCVLKSAGNWLDAFGGGKWLSVDAAVTADPTRLNRSGCSAVEIVYSYQVDGVLYTGSHEEPFWDSSETDYMKRFPRGRSLVVRVKPGEPEVVVMRDRDQTDGLRKRLQGMGKL
jgi:hypothetical protein